VRWRELALVAALVLVALCVPALGAGPSDTNPTGSRGTTRIMSGAGFAGTEETTVSGLVVDADGKPLVDIAVKLYVGGLLVAEVATSTDGGFELVELIDYGQDVTIDLWFVPPTDELVMENVLLKESSLALEQRLYSQCVSRVRLDPITDVIVKLRDLDARNKMLEEKGCIG